MTHPIIEDLLWRYSTKRYDASRKIPQKDLDVLYEAMRLSASSINSQPWKFIVIESEEAKHRMHNTFTQKHLNNQPHIFDSSQIILFSHNPRYSRDDFSKMIDKAIADQRVTGYSRK